MLVFVLILVLVLVLLLALASAAASVSEFVLVSLIAFAIAFVFALALALVLVLALAFVLKPFSADAPFFTGLAIGTRMVLRSANDWSQVVTPAESPYHSLQQSHKVSRSCVVYNPQSIKQHGRMRDIARNLQRASEEAG